MSFWTNIKCNVTNELMTDSIFQLKIQTFQKFVHLISTDQKEGDRDFRIKSSINRIHAE